MECVKGEPGVTRRTLLRCALLGVTGTLMDPDGLTRSLSCAVSGDVRGVDIAAERSGSGMTGTTWAQESLVVPEFRPSVPRSSWRLIEPDQEGHGAVFVMEDPLTYEHKYCMMVSGTPSQMGAAHGRLMRMFVRRLVERVVYGITAAEAVANGTWLPETLREIEKRTLPHIPVRFMEECDAMSGAVGISSRDGRYANLFPERFHCSGFAVRGQASINGQVLHARVLDYMRDIALQRYAAVQIFRPDGYIPWMSLGYAGFIGTVTAMNAEGVAVGEMGGGGEGAWDGVPMSLLLRDVMERAESTDDAVRILRQTPRTCEYYYVISDKRGAICGVKATPERVEVLGPGERHPELPEIPPDTVMISAGDRAVELSRRLREEYGKIDVPAMIRMMRRPVAMRSNLHNAVFAPQSLEMWFADAGRDTPACDEIYQYCSLSEMLPLYDRVMKKR
ncbi:MAG: C45 family peptidase [Planctomycetia bacterium]|nr:C45 family peptidase [Planctomycetia bacterium]